MLLIPVKPHCLALEFDPLKKFQSDFRTACAKIVTSAKPELFPSSASRRRKVSDATLTARAPDMTFDMHC
ncbi:hypothetical protein PoB_007593400 [Plakobranchus ocellatus]|uniref:Uncharacterized protein n=1 Tax=Plakobranchus ocellatus TaxID=259542 RepID=A0AAV4DZE0_9GAST|nr:hypothetical protein PoB_007593400 [Plakobranchus ocellatus]